MYSGPSVIRIQVCSGQFWNYYFRTLLLLLLLLLLFAVGIQRVYCDLGNYVLYAIQANFIPQTVNLRVALYVYVLPFHKCGQISSSVLLRKLCVLVLFYLCNVNMKNLCFATARVSSNRGGEFVLDDVPLFEGEECSGGFSLQLHRVLHLSIN